jgi:hypothetical protein
VFEGLRAVVGVVEDRPAFEPTALLLRSQKLAQTFHAAAIGEPFERTVIEFPCR